MSGPLGDIIRRQRELQALSMRQFARTVGISNPYLSQIERGLREPSEHVLQSIADSLDTTIDRLYEQAGVQRHDDDGGEPEVIAAIRADPALSARHRSALIEVYDAFSGRAGPRRRRSSARERPASSEASVHEAPRDP